jgi:Uma2 family endonuclease
MNQPAQNIVREEPARFTIEEFEPLALALVAAGSDDRLELIDGVMTRMPPPQMPHGYWLARLHLKLGSVLDGSGLQTWLDTGLRFAADTLRVPDLLLVRGEGPGEGYVQTSDVLLAVEIAHTTLVLDLGQRKLRFARAGVPHYWVVDVEGQRVHRFSDPRDGDYAAHEEQGFDAPLPVPGTDKVVQLG